MSREKNEIEKIARILEKIIEKHVDNIRKIPKKEKLDDMKININGKNGLVHLEGGENEILFGLSMLVSTLKYGMEFNDADIQFSVEFGLKHDVEEK